MNNPALMELADRLAAFTKISESGRNDDGVEGVAIPGVDCYHFDDLMRQAATEINRLTELCDKYKWQVRDTCARAEKAEAQLRTAAAEGGKHVFVGDPNSAGHVHYCLKCNVVEGLDTTPAECARPDAAAYCDPTNPFNGEAFSWPGTARDPEHTTPLYLHPPTDSGAGRDAATHVSVPYETLRYLAYATRGMQICCGQGQQTGPDEIQCCGQPMDAGEELGRLLPDVPRMYGAPSTDDTAIAGAAGEADRG